MEWFYSRNTIDDLVEIFQDMHQNVYGEKFEFKKRPGRCTIVRMLEDLDVQRRVKKGVDFNS